MPHKRPGSPYWQIRVRGVRHSSGTKDRQAAKALEDKLNREAFETDKLGICHTAWDEACLEYLTQAQLAGMSSLADQKSRAKFWKKYLSGKKLKDITPEYVRTILLTRKGVNEYTATPENTTANMYATFVGRIIHAHGLPFKWKFFKQPAGREEWLTLAQWRLIASLLPEEWRQVATFSLVTGLRQANVIGLQWSWLSGACLLIPSTEAKTRVPYGVPLNKTAQQIITDRRSASVVHATNVFTVDGRKITPYNIWHIWVDAVAAAGVPHITYHGLRHTYASWMVQAGVPFEIVSRLGHWSRGKGMVHRYSHFDLEGLRPYAEKMDEILSTKSSQQQSGAA